MDIREQLRGSVQKVLGELGLDGTEPTLEHPAELSHGDYATSAALQYAKVLSMPPRALAEKIQGSLAPHVASIATTEIAGPGFINFRLVPGVVSTSVEQARSDEKWGSNDGLEGDKIMVEYTDPNPFKQFHIGHLMSNAIGESISRLLEFSGADVQRANYQGDVGPHVAKAIWGIKTLGADPHDAAQLGKAYAAGAQAYEGDAATKEEIDAINKQVYDRSDAEINELYAAGRAASLAHFEELYKVLGTTFDHYFFESVTGPRGLALVEAHPNVFEQSEGATVFRGEKVGLHTRVFVTSKGLPTYETKDLGLAQLKAETWPFDMSITVTAHEQADYFAVVKAVLSEVLPEIAPKIEHVSHGMMRFASGKMSSRTGDVITGESLLDELQETAKERAAESRADNKDELAQQVAVAAIKYQVLRQASRKDIIFDRERALSLEGDSGPYLQYTHARTCAVGAKAAEQGIEPRIDAEAAASDLMRLLHRFPEMVEYAAHELEPHLVTTYLLEVASAFNSWYAQEQILDGTPAAAHKVALTEAVRRTLRNGLWILGIPAPEKM